MTGRLAGAHAVRRVLLAKLFELRHTPSAWWLTTGTVAYGVAVVMLLLALLDVESWDEAGLRALLATAGGSGALMVLFGVVFAAGEYRHRTIVPLMLAEPRRLPALTGQLVAYAVAGLVTGLAATSVLIVAVSAWLSVRGEPFDLGAGALAAIIAGGAVYAALGAVLGGGVGALTRNQVAAAIVVFAYVAMVDPPLAQAIPEYGKFGPTALGIAMSGGVPAPSGPGQQLLGWPLATAVWGGTAILCSAAAAVVTRRREIG
jgi:ABC-2 type transport system permease protein